MRTPLAATLASLFLAGSAFAQGAEEPISSASLDPFGLALLGAGLSGLALSRLLRRRG